MSVRHDHPMIPSKPTVFGGVTFRSRLEARWAVFFARLGLEWQYEPRAYTTESWSGRYTPDFRLPELGMLIEIKPHKVVDQYLVEKYSVFGPDLVKSDECKLFMFAVGAPRPGSRLVGWWRYGERTFSFEALYGDEAVRAAAIVATHKVLSDADETATDSIFGSLSMDELRALTVHEVKLVLAAAHKDDPGYVAWLLGEA